MSRRGDYSAKIYVGDLPREATEREVEQAFRSYGKIRNVWVARNPPGFAFVEYDDANDARDAVRDLDGSIICGVRARVELSTGKSRPKPWLRGSRGSSPRRSRPFDPSHRCYECGERGHYAYDCRRRNGRNDGRKRSRSRSWSRGTRSRSRSR